MGLFSNKKERRVPDLSRYEQHYDRPARSNSLSSDAAAAALRTYSLNSSSNYNSNKYAYQQDAQPRRNSLRANSLSYGARNHNSARSNSLSNGYPRTSSLRGSSAHSSSSNPIIIHTTKTEDEYGRTKSITTETIQQFGSYQIVKKETTELNLPKQSIRNRSKFLAPPFIGGGGGGYAESLLSNDLGSIREEQEEVGYIDEFASFSGNGVSDYKQSPLEHSPRRSPVQIKPIKSILKEDTNTPETGSDATSIYSDAVENVASDKDVRFKNVSSVPVKKTGSKSSLSSATKRPKFVAKPVPEPVRVRPTEAEMFEKAMEIAKQRVYGTANPVMPPSSEQSRPTSFRRYSLRDRRSSNASATADTNTRFNDAVATPASTNNTNFPNNSSNSALQTPSVDPQENDTVKSVKNKSKSKSKPKSKSKSKSKAKSQSKSQSETSPDNGEYSQEKPRKPSAFRRVFNFFSAANEALSRANS